MKCQKCKCEEFNYFGSKITDITKDGWVQIFYKCVKCGNIQAETKKANNDEVQSYLKTNVYQDLDADKDRGW